jgi:hypothetical protein
MPFRRILALAALALSLAASSFAQTPQPANPKVDSAPSPQTPSGPQPGVTATTGSLRGRAVDPTNAVIPGVTITLTDANGHARSTQSTGDGTYLIPNLAPGTYSVHTSVNGFADFDRPGVAITAAISTRVNLHLQPNVSTTVNVSANGSQQLSVASDSNASSLVLTGKDLDALSDDPDELSDELNALAGPAAGPNGGQIYIDGFTGGTLPPKSSIREIRINQNPFSAQYDQLGYGRIEVFTKPGTDKLHGQFILQGNDNAFNTTALVGATPQPPYHTLFFQGNLTGPLSKKASYNLSVNDRDIQSDSIINTTILGGANTYTPVNTIQSVFTPQTRVDVSPRLDLQITPTNTLTARYQFNHNGQTNANVGGNNLASTAYSTFENNNEIQASDSQTFGNRVISETRFEYTRDTTTNTVQNPATSIYVQGAQNSGGSGYGNYNDVATHFEVQSYTSVQLTNNFIRFGGRLRYSGDSNTNTTNFNGGFTYGQSSVTYDAALQSAYNALGYNSAGSTCYPGSIALGSTIPVSGICNYGLTQYYLNNSQTPHANIGPTQYTVDGGNPNISASVSDVGLYAEDEWKIRPSFTATYGIRYETQNRISDHHDVAPHVSVAWGLLPHNGAPTFVVRGGYAIFFNRYGLGQVENVQRFNGVTELALTVKNPGCYTAATCPAATPTTTLNTDSQAPNLRTPYVMQAGGSIEHQINKNWTATATYLNSRGQHQFFSQNLQTTVGASTYNNYQYVSEGIFKQNQLIVNSSYRGPAGTSLFGFYVFSHSNADTSGSGSFPSNPALGITADYGRAGFDVHHRLFLGGSAQFPYHITASPFLVVNSGAPFNITLGQDLIGDLIYNQRPAFCSATTTAANTVNSKYGCFDKGTTLAEPRVPINYAQGPAQFTLNMRITKTIGFGPKLGGKSAQQSGPNGPPPGPMGGGPGGEGHGGGGGHHGGGGMFGGGGTSTGRKYNLTLGAQGLNIFNVVNYSNPVGNISSPQFGQQTQLAGGIFSSNNGGTAVRRITLQANFTF